MTKAIFFDIDGTLLSYRSHQVLPSTIEAFRMLHKKGIRTFVSSGRPLVLIPPMPVHFDGYITVNGGFCLAGDTVLLRNPIDADDCRRWLDYVEQNNLVTMCFTENDMFINRVDDAVLRLHDQLGFKMPPVRPLSDFLSLSLSDVPSSNQQHKNAIYQFIAMQPACNDEQVLATLSHCRMPRWHPAFTDIIPINSSKAVGIECILNHFGISREESMAFGDGANDIEMLEYVGTGIAMGNAADIVKQHADFVTLSADNDGILHALQTLRLIDY